MDQRSYLFAVTPAIGKGLFQLVETSIAEQNLQEGTIRERHISVISGRGFPGFDRSQFAFLKKQSHTVTIKADLDLEAMPNSNRFGDPLFEGGLDMVQETH